MSTPSPMPTPTPASVQPEFDAQQSALIKDLANAMTWVCIPLLALGALYLAGFVQVLLETFARPRIWPMAVYVLLASVFFLAIGIWTSRAAASFQKIAETSGQDMTHLMSALSNLRNLYGLLRLLVLAYLITFVIALVAGLVTYFTMRSDLA